jgi:hypothetical protein
MAAWAIASGLHLRKSPPTIIAGKRAPERTTFLSKAANSKRLWQIRSRALAAALDPE